MRLIFSATAWEHYQWFNEREPALFKRLNALIKETLRTPFYGIGKPEPLRGKMSGFWSKRINDEHRLVYKVVGTDLLIATCRHHYDD